MPAPLSAFPSCRSVWQSKWTRSSPSATDILFAGRLGFAHRGLHGPGRPENSLAAFRAAVEAKAGIECDLRLSHDGVPMVFHDPSLQRLCGLSAETESLDADQLGALHLAGSSERIPRLDDLLGVAGEAPLLLELKKGRASIEPLCRKVAQLVAAYPGPVGVMSFDAEVGQWFAIHAPEVPRGLVIDRPPPSEREGLLRTAVPDFVAVSVRSIADLWVAELRAAGVRTGCWTVKSAAQRRQVAVHADALIWEGDGRP